MNRISPGRIYGYKIAASSSKENNQIINANNEKKNTYSEIV